MRITLVHQAALGDTILLIPLLRALTLRWPDARITLVTRPAFGQLLVMLGYAHAWSSADDRDHTLWFAPPESPTEPNSRPAWSSTDLLISAVSTGHDAWSANARLAWDRLSSRSNGGGVWDRHPADQKEGGTPALLLLQLILVMP